MADEKEDSKQDVPEVIKPERVIDESIIIDESMIDVPLTDFENAEPFEIRGTFIRSDENYHYFASADSYFKTHKLAAISKALEILAFERVYLRIIYLGENRFKIISVK